MFLFGDSQEDTNRGSSSSFFVSFILRWNQFKRLVLIISLSLFSMFSHAGAILNRSPLAILLFRSAQDISEDTFPFSILSSSFEDVTSFKTFNSTGATSLLNHFNGVSFEWALTHRSFSRILPDSSYFPGVILNSFSKSDVRMIHHQSYVFLQDLSISFHRWLNLSILHSGVPQ